MTANGLASSTSSPVAKWLVGLESHQLVTKAMRSTGLADFDGLSFAEPLEVLTRALDGQAALTRRGRADARSRLVGLLAERARTAALLSEHPEILSLDIDEPIVLLGMPPAGTRLICGLLAADPGLRTGPPSDSDLLAIDFASMDFEYAWHVPAFAEWYFDADLAPRYEYLVKLLRVQQWQEPGGRWVLHGFQHLEQLGPLLTVFPRAVVIQVHRDPVAVLAEWTATLSERRSRSSHVVGHAKIAKYWAWRIQILLDRSIEGRIANPSHPVFDLPYADLVDDPGTAISKIYRASGRELTIEVEAEMRRRVLPIPDLIDIERYGIERTSLRERFAPYCDQFGVAPET